MISRRRFIVQASTGVIGAPVLTHAEPAGKMARVGVVIAGAPDSNLNNVPMSNWPVVMAFEEGMKALGYSESRNVVYDHRHASGNTAVLPDRIADMVRLQIDVIVALNTPAVVAAQKVTKRTPIVMAYPVDPVGTGLIKSLAYPGGNTTGLSLQLSDIAGKRIELLREVNPSLGRLAVLWDPRFAGMRTSIRATEVSASQVRIPLELHEASSDAEVDVAFDDMAKTGARGLIVWGSDTLFDRRSRIAQRAIKAHMPTICPFREYVEEGCLMSYSASITDLARRAASYVDKILRGAKPADLPVEQPTKFDLVINLKTAKALGFTIPPSLLFRADQIIE